jgi:DNA-directed RNA polymerase specialized sigma subunit
MDDPFPNIDLSCLTPRQREVVEMRYECNLSWRAIGTFLGINHMVVKRHHDRAIERLLDSMQGYTSPPSIDA